jgi:hypothetical protein
MLGGFAVLFLPQNFFRSPPTSEAVDINNILLLTETTITNTTITNTTILAAFVPPITF